VLRDPSLVPLSHQHHNGLALCVLTRRSLRAGAAAADVAKLAQRVVDRYELELTNHFAIEEQILFPAMRSRPDETALVDGLIRQHRELEALVARLRAAPSAALLEEFCDLLTRHIRREESELFQLAQARLPELVLSELGAAIEARVVRICL
jgi:iron-sulfur cluster repair protein YtfE (RIC family)